MRNSAKSPFSDKYVRFSSYCVIVSIVVFLLLVYVFPFFGVTIEPIVDIVISSLPPIGALGSTLLQIRSYRRIKRRIKDK